MKNFAKEYHKILHPQIPEFLKPFLELPILTRLKGVGLLCSTDWTPLYHNYFPYSRFDHSLGCALITWNFTHNKMQTISALLHDVSTPAFSHVGDFRKGDALTQSSTEDLNQQMILEDSELSDLLKPLGLTAEQVCNYHRFPVCDNEIPQLSSDRLEYMYPSGAALDKFWNLKSIRKNYNDIIILKNQEGIDELGFKSKKQAALYTKKFCQISLLLQHNENKLTLQLMAQIMNLAVELKYLTEEQSYSLTEKQIIELFDKIASEQKDSQFAKLYHAFRTMKKIKRSNVELENHFNVCIEVKRRYIDPLVLQKNGSAVRISKIHKASAKWIQKALNFKDAKYGSIQL